ncbi:hypothetical protein CAUPRSCDRAFT_12668, partial [Caulochytrium protostelioides]
MPPAKRHELLMTARLDETQFIPVTMALGLPRYLNAPLFDKAVQPRFVPGSAASALALDVAGGAAAGSPAASDAVASVATAAEGADSVSHAAAAAASPSASPEKPALTAGWNEVANKLWPSLVNFLADPEELAFMALMPLSRQLTTSPSRRYLTKKDFESVIEDVMQHHPGLEFLQGLITFQVKYVETVYTRIFWQKATGNWVNRMTLPEFRRSDFTNVIDRLNQLEDINLTRDVFSYKHFYVIYCRFWELDSDHDMIINEQALMCHDRSAITPRMAHRILQ